MVDAKDSNGSIINLRSQLKEAIEKKNHEFGMGCHLPSKDVELFIVTNSAKRSIYVVALNPTCARWLAFHANHIRDERNGIVRRAKANGFINDKPFGSALQRAVVGRQPGAIVRVGDHATILSDPHSGIPGAVYAPLSSV